jgi:hypothetical protein
MVAFFHYLRRKHPRIIRPGQPQPGVKSNTRRSVAPAAVSLCLAVALISLSAASIQQAGSFHPPVTAPKPQEQVPTIELEPASPLKPKQKRELLKANFEKMKKDADDLATLAKSLQEDIAGSNENVLSLKVVDKADKIEKLAKQIKTRAKVE